MTGRELRGARNLEAPLRLDEPAGSTTAPGGVLPSVVCGAWPEGRESMSASPSKRSNGGNDPLRKVTAIVRVDVLERVERRLQELRVPGISVTRVKGYGEYEDYFARDWMTEHARIEIFLRRERSDEVARAIIDAAHTGGAGDGIVVVLPVESIYRIRSGEVATSDELGGCECARSSDDTTPQARDHLEPR